VTLLGELQKFPKKIKFFFSFCRAIFWKGTHFFLEERNKVLLKETTVGKERLFGEN